MKFFLKDTGLICGLSQVSLFFVLFFILCQGSLARDKKINLKDVKIQGQGLDNSKIFLSNKDRTDVEKHLKIRKNFREEILSDLPPSVQSKKRSKSKKKIK